MHAFATKGGQGLSASIIHAKLRAKHALGMEHVLQQVILMPRASVRMVILVIIVRRLAMDSVLESFHSVALEAFLELNDTVVPKVEAATIWVQARNTHLEAFAPTNRSKRKSVYVEVIMIVSWQYLAVLMGAVPLLSTCLTIQPVIQFLSVLVKAELAQATEHQSDLQDSQRPLRHRLS